MLAKKNRGHIGGADVLQTLLAKELARYGFKITFIVYEMTTGIKNIGGIKVIKISNGKRSKLLKVLSIWKAMKKADADIYYHHSGAQGIVSIFCWVNKKKFICHISSDAYITRKVKNYRLWNLDIKLADIVIVQNKLQKAALRSNFDREGVLIRNFFPISRRESSKKADPQIVLWVGRIDPVKQPALFLKLAKKIPEAKCQMIGGVSGNEKFYEIIKNLSKRIPNLNFIGFVPFYEIDDYFKRAAILVNTSTFEGYPNTFIQAWMHYTPVISLNADPDEVICKYRLGFHSRTFGKMVQDVRALVQDRKLREEMGENARKFVEKEHNKPHIISKYIEIFKTI